MEPQQGIQDSKPAEKCPSLSGYYNQIVEITSADGGGKLPPSFLFTPQEPCHWNYPNRDLKAALETLLSILELHRGQSVCFLPPIVQV